MPTMPTAIMALVRLGPRIAVMAMASRIDGKASRMSMTRMITRSSQPPK